jgi:hypothetical protein
MNLQDHQLAKGLWPPASVKWKALPIIILKSMSWLLLLALFIVTIFLVWRLGSNALAANDTKTDATTTTTNHQNQTGVAPISLVICQPATPIAGTKMACKVMPAASPTFICPCINSADAAPAKEKEDNTKDAVANAMTAIGTAVGVITLLLTLGTYYINKRQEELSVLVEAERLRAESHEQQQKLGLLHSQALQELLPWLQSLTASPETVIRDAMLIGWHLNLLQSTSSDVRKKAFDSLTASKFMLPRPQDPFPPELKQLRTYTEKCHRFHALRERQDEEASGMWCLLFDNAERRLFKSLYRI